MKHLLLGKKYAAAIAVIVGWLVFSVMLPSIGIGRTSSVHSYGLFGSIRAVQARGETTIDVNPKRLGLELLLLAVVAVIAEGLSRVLSPPVPSAGRCVACGYDLRGSAGSVCPECGTSNVLEK